MSDDPHEFVTLCVRAADPDPDDLQLPNFATGVHPDHGYSFFINPRRNGWRLDTDDALDLIDRLLSAGSAYVCATTDQDVLRTHQDVAFDPTDPAVRQDFDTIVERDIDAETRHKLERMQEKLEANQ